ncbi:MAG TPA: hypothetical protein VJ992_04855 [Gemmatimonadales bacterium]|nr:hypothetical protein [Gemmatimonadales bacterium]
MARGFRPLLVGALLAGCPAVAWAQQPAPRPPIIVVPRDSLRLPALRDSALRRLATAFGARGLPACPMPVGPAPITAPEGVAPHAGRVPYMPTVPPGCRNPLFRKVPIRLDSVRVVPDTTH